MFNIKEFDIPIEDTQIHCIRFGRGKKTLILLPGLTLQTIHNSGYMLAWMYRIFSLHYTSYVIDKRDTFSKEVTILDLAKDVLFCLDHLNIQECDILAVSMGGMIAQELALFDKSRLQKMIIAFSASRNNSYLKKAIEEWLGYISRKDQNGLVISFVKYLYSPSYQKRYRLLLPLIAKINRHVNMDRMQILAKACLTCNTYERLKEIETKIFIFGAGLDQVVGIEASLEMINEVGCSYYIYERLGHAAYEEAKDFNQRVMAFLEEEDKNE